MVGWERQGKQVHGMYGRIGPVGRLGPDGIDGQQPERESINGRCHCLGKIREGRERRVCCACSILQGRPAACHQGAAQLHYLRTVSLSAGAGRYFAGGKVRRRDRPGAGSGTGPVHCGNQDRHAYHGLCPELHASAAGELGVCRQVDPPVPVPPGRGDPGPRHPVRVHEPVLCGGGEQAGQRAQVL